MAVAILICLIMPPGVFENLRNASWKEQGRREAESDIAVGSMKYKIFGHTAGCTEQDKIFSRQMHRHHNVTVVVVGLCEVSEEQVANAEGYNARIEAELGSEALRRVWNTSYNPVNVWAARLKTLLIFLLATVAVILLRWRVGAYRRTAH